MQKIRGYVFFEDKSLSDIKNTFKEFRFDQAVFSFFTSITLNEENFSCPGVFMSGEIKESYDRDYVIRLFRKLLGLNDDLKHSSLSLAGVDKLKPVITTDHPYGCYSCLVIASPESLDNIELLAGEIKRLAAPRDLWIRTVSRENGQDSVCIDMLGESFLDMHSEELNDFISGLDLIIEQNSRINLIK